LIELYTDLLARVKGPVVLYSISMVCPNCGYDVKFELRSAIAQEPHGETYDSEWWECTFCGAPADEVEIERENEKAKGADGPELQRDPHPL
jgi:C4-type Zn-finger protein